MSDDPTTTTDPFDAPATPETIVYVVGHNLTGYLPESEPSYVLTAVDALEVLRSNLDSLADHHHNTTDDTWPDDPAHEYIAACDEAMAEITAVLARFTDESLREEAARDAIAQGVGDVYVEHAHHWIERRTLTEVDPGLMSEPITLTVGEVLDHLNDAY